MEATLAAARAGATTGEWAQALRDAFGSYRAPDRHRRGRRRRRPTDDMAELRDEVARVGEALGRTMKILVGKPGLDGHSNGAEQIAVRARDVGMEVVYEGIRLTPTQIARSAVDEGVHVIGLSILSGSHRELIPAIMDALRRPAARTSPSSCGGIIPRPTSSRSRRPASPRSTRRRTSTCRRSCATSSTLVEERNGVTARGVSGPGRAPARRRPHASRRRSSTSSSTGASARRPPRC